MIAVPIAAFMWAIIYLIGSFGVSVYNDGGGKVREYLIRNLKTEEVRIMGKCYSACTLGLKHENVCIGPNARLFFHAPRNMLGLIDADATRNFVALYPEWVQYWINKNGGLKSNWMEMPREYLENHVKAC